MRTLLVLVLFTLGSCNFGNKEVQSSDTSGDTPEANTESVIDKSLETPWRGWNAPTKLNGYTLTALIVDPNKRNELYSTMAVYKKGDQFIRVLIVDGSTDKGNSEIRQHLKIVDQNINSESEYGYEKSITHKGLKANEQFLAGVNEYLIKFLYQNEYGVTVKSNTESRDAIWSFIDQLKLDALQ